jgi:hypothetical protein
MMVGLCNNSSIVNKERNKQMPRITYALIRIDEDVKHLEKTLQDMVKVDDSVVLYSTKQITVKDEEDIGGPVIYFP